MFYEILGSILFSVVLAAIPFGFVAAIVAVWRKKLILVPLFLLLSLVAWQLIPEGYFYPYPLIDTVHSEQFTIKKLEQIRQGMTKDEVTQLIGQTKGNYNYVEAGPLYCERQTDDGALRYWDFAWLNAVVCYDAQDKVDHTGYSWQED